MKKFFLFFLFILSCQFSFSQKYFTRSGKISFYSEAPVETIEAVNQTVSSVIDVLSKRIEIGVLIKAFQFEKALMQQHFNENYLESDEYPKAIFKGTLNQLEMVNFDEAGEYELIASGDLTLHGVTKEISIPAMIVIEEGKIAGHAQFILKPADFDIKIPSIVRDNIAREIEVTALFIYESFGKS